MNKKTHNIVILDGHAANPGDLDWSVLEEFGSITVYERTKREELLERATDADIILVNKVLLDKEMLSQLPKLKYIGILATGTNVVDLKAARELGIVVTNIPTYSTNSVAQLVFAHLLNIVNRVDKYACDNRNGRWAASPDFCFWDGTIHELSALTLGIVGLGNIGKAVARIAIAMGMDVVASTSKSPDQLPDGVRKMPLDTLLATCDVISLHCPLTPDTHEMINRDSLQKMHPGAILINTGRGPLVNEHDVAEALQSGQLGAYATDVLCQEPPAADNPLFACDNAYITPHLAWGTIEARKRLMQICIDNLKAYTDNKPINVVNEL